MNYEFTGLITDSDGSRYYIQNGCITGKYTGLVKHTDGKLYYVKNSKVDTTYNAVEKYSDGKYYNIKNGKNDGKAAAVVSSGKFSNSLNWQVLDCNTLVISGKGKMEDFDSPSDTPWYGSRKKIVTLFVEDGVTKVGKYAFADCMNLEKKHIADSVVYVDGTAFEGCSKLK